MFQLRRTLVVLALALFAIPADAQSPPPRDPRAVAVLTQSLAAMGGTVPSDSVVTATATITEGDAASTGTARFVARGADETIERIEINGEIREVIYSNGVAKHRTGSKAEIATFELTQSSQSSHFPLSLIAAALNDSESAFEYLGLVKIAGSDAHHIRIWKTYSSKPKLSPFAELSTRELWIDAKTGLPLKLAYEIRKTRGPVAAIPAEIYYSEYQAHEGVLYPHRIEKSLNGSPWAVFVVQSVSLNNGVSPTQFRIQ